MAAKNKFMNAMKMPAIADMFSSEADRQRESGDLVTEVPLSELHPFVNHPFEVRDDEEMSYMKQHFREPHFFIESAEGNDYFRVTPKVYDNLMGKPKKKPSREQGER
jgi:hypothetical protein